MSSDHYANIINQSIELCYYSGMDLESIGNISSDEFGYILNNFKTLKETEEKNKQELRKSIFEYANKGLETLFNLLSKLGKSR
jgi:hypothetical protein